MTVRSVGLLALAIVLVSAQDPCGVFPTCATCVANPLCGWCSEPVAYQNGTAGKQCAGFNPSSNSTPFVCNGIYSTGQCQQGYICNNATWQCELGPAGSGEPLDKCQAQCDTTGKTYVCNNQTHACEVAPAGTGTDINTCRTQCVVTASPNPSSSPGPTSSSSPSSSSPSPASPSPSGPTPSPTPLYTCNQTTYQCVQGTSGSSQQACQQTCIKPKPTPVPPTPLLGLWRGLEVQSGYPNGEFDFNFDSTGVQMSDPNGVVTKGTVVTTGQQFTMTFPNAVYNCIFNVGPILPEVSTSAIACGKPGSAAPATIQAAMGNGVVWELLRCVPDGICSFHLGNSMKQPLLRTAEHNTMGSLLKTMLTVHDLTVDDHCSAFGDSCPDCISHQYCGWCSQPVVYNDGSTGTRCAGFNPSGGKNSFVCTGTYSTEMCIAGWVCNSTSQQCFQGQPGEGTQKDVCVQSCKLTPITPVDMIGVWRGLMINNGYVYGEWDFNITQSGLVEKFQGKVVFTGLVAQQGANFVITETFPTPGNVYKGLRSQSQDPLVTFMTLGSGAPNGAAPTDFKVPMKTPDHELVLMKCIDSSCHFNF